MLVLAYAIFLANCIMLLNGKQYVGRQPICGHDLFPNPIRSTGICCDICPANLEGKKFKIKVVQNNKFWHFDGGHTVLKAVTSLWQPNDAFVKFMFEKQPDGSYKIKSVAMPSIYMYDGYGVPNAHGQVLNGNDQTEDYHMRYIVSRDGSNYRIQTKATNRYVRLDPDQYVSSKHNIIDDRSLFELMEVV
ncbi:uncharacterized protein LOC128559797 [Mercenaria mercenaria]|uniref:uncharacterized protein LOC128559797 n=1 Tax=Mercenaria mercenaria TaxID=6596 RepID=UPI00234EFCB2|nr:uncharacterized protein LOC128559797 [Mercenaria mercenaria]